MHACSEEILSIRFSSLETGAFFLIEPWFLYMFIHLVSAFRVRWASLILYSVALYRLHNDQIVVLLYRGS